MLYSLLSNGLVKDYNCSDDCHMGDYECGILLLKVIFDKFSLQTHATVVNERAILTNIPELTDLLTQNMNELNSMVILMINNLKKNGSSSPGLLRQLLPAYLSYPDNHFQDYITLKQNKFEEVLS